VEIDELELAGNKRPRKQRLGDGPHHTPVVRVAKENAVVALFAFLLHLHACRQASLAHILRLARGQTQQRRPAPKPGEPARYLLDEMLGKCGEWFKLLEESVHVLPQRIGELFPVAQVREEAGQRQCAVPLRRECTRPERGEGRRERSSYLDEKKSCAPHMSIQSSKNLITALNG